jgi:anti-anti-sigma factor
VTIIDTRVQDGLLTIRQAFEGERIRVCLEGELDLANAKTAEGVLAAALASGRDVLVDLGQLEFLDSTGVSMLVMALRDPGAERLRFLPSESLAVRRLLSMTGLDERLGLAAREETSTSLPAA